MNEKKLRALWVAGTRSELLHLGPAFKFLRASTPPEGGVHLLAYLGEQGTAAYQAIDFLDLKLDEAYELRYLAEDPAIRLTGLMADVESLARRRRVTRLLFSGFGPLAAAAALVCLGRQCRGLWVRPRDPAGLIPRLRWERGLERVILSLNETVDAVQVRDASENSARGAQPATGAPDCGRRPGAPLTLIAVGRMLWGMQGVFELLVRAAARWAREFPSADWLILRTLDPRLEGPLQSLKDRPRNLLASPPLPYNEYCGLLREAACVVTDSCHVAAEATDLRRPIVALAESSVSRAPSKPGDRLLEITPDDLDCREILGYLKSALEHPADSGDASPRVAGDDPELIAAIQGWLATPGP